eukprot:TRINITY_DN2019_c0_g1_i1.p1 TRINITY_DN2019_c0_g1~~TRINITY_DN2019_c0_g1_i1.p1  ORF type:complete len:199 (-),score=48.83 TRINITY_DN2019_c0_g1_i1:14-610(-)
MKQSEQDRFDSYFKGNKIIRIADDRLSPENIQRLSDILKADDSEVEHFIFNNCGLNSEIMKTLADGIKHNTSLKVLDFGRNVVDHNVYYAIWEAIEYNTTITEIILPKKHMKSFFKGGATEKFILEKIAQNRIQNENCDDTSDIIYHLRSDIELKDTEIARLSHELEIKDSIIEQLENELEDYKKTINFHHKKNSEQV